MKIVAYVAKKIELEVNDEFKLLIDDYDFDVADTLVEAIHNQDSEIVEVLTVWDETNTEKLV